MIDGLMMEMVHYYAGDAHQIQHFMKVHGYARLIGTREKVCAQTMEVLEAAALVHDIGIKPAMEKYGRCDGPLQEKEGAPIAKEMLKRLSFGESVVDRVCFLVAHHHTYADIDGIDYQILVEADFLVNLHEGKKSREAAEEACCRIFRTETGKNLCRQMFLA